MKHLPNNLRNELHGRELTFYGIDVQAHKFPDLAIGQSKPLFVLVSVNLHRVKILFADIPAAREVSQLVFGVLQRLLHRRK